MAKKIGPKEMEMRKHREASNEHDILKQIEDDEREAYREFETQLKVKREKALAAVIDPLKSEANNLRQVVNESNSRIAEIERQLAKLTGKQVADGGRKRAKRKSEAEKLQIAKLVHGMLKDSGEPLAASQLAGVADGIAVSQLFTLWNAAYPKDRITKTGDKASTRYSVE